METINQRIDFLIKELGFTKTKFAESLHVSSQFVSSLCSGAKQPSDRTIADICREYGVSETWLRTGEGEMKQKLTRNQEIAEFMGVVMHISIRTPAWGVTAKIHKTVFNHLYIFAALCAFCSEITQQKAIIIRILKENTSIHCADLPENYARLRSAQAGLTEAAAHRFRSDRCGQLPRFGFDSCSPGDRCGWNPFPCK